MAREPDDPRRRMVVRALGLGLLGSGLAARQAAAQLLGSRPGQMPPGRSFYRVVGDVRVNGTPASLQTVLRAGDTVTTGAGGEAVFVMGSHAMILRERSAVTVQAEQVAETLAVRAMRMLSGALLSVSRGSGIALQTANASIGIRGTGFYVEAEPQETYFCTCYGVTEVAASDDPQSRETISASHHDRPVWILNAGPGGKRIRNAPFINHTDQELSLIEALVGRETPFVFPKDAYGGPRREY
ncbi:MAG TPA: FecR domain-containing protein [Usitatibacter sp.]|nr:FecR domain-containing protein [Usitatibacter sp.]